MPDSAIQTFDQYGLADNQRVQLLKVLKEALTSGTYGEIDITVGFLFLSGLSLLKEELDQFFKDGGRMRIVMGSITNKETSEMLAAAYQSIEDLKEEWNKRHFAQKKEEEKKVEEEKQTYSLSVGVMDQNERNASFLKKLKEWIENGNMQIRVYTKEYMHAKAYLFKPKNPSSLNFGSVGSSNFSLGGFSGNTELNAIITSTHMTNLSEWFEKIWDEAVDFNPHLLQVIQDNWPSHDPGNFPSPYHVLIRGLIELYGTVEGQENVVAPSIMEMLYDFQRDAVKRAVEIINKYGGVLISDVVGLGKSFIGLALLQHFSLKAMFDGIYGYKVAVFSPPKLKSMWDEYLDKFEIKGETFSIGLLSKCPEDDGTYSPKLQEIEEKLKDVEVVLIDEVHKISNPTSCAYMNIQRLIENRKVILLTATPYRKSFEDIVRQIQLFMPQEYHKFPITPPRWSDVIKAVENGTLDPAYILREVMVRRTRQDIINLYGRGGERCIKKGKKKECFPERELKTVTYNISSVYSVRDAPRSDIEAVIEDEFGDYYDGKASEDYKDIYSVVLAGIRTLLYTRYDLFRYVRQNYKEVEPYRSLKHAGRNLRGIMKTHYLKRLESSVHAFYLSLKKNIAITETFMKFMELGYLPVGEKFDDLLYKYDSSGEPRSLTDEEIQKLIDDIIEEYKDIEKSPLRKYKLKAFKTKELWQALQYDLDKLKALLRIVERVHADVKEKPWKDDKLRTLADIVDDILASYDKRKVLIFSEYEDTVDWICKGLEKMVKNGQLGHPELWRDNFECVSSSSNVEGIAARFSPKSMSKASSYARAIVANNKEIDVLITTDVLSEGMNLQDANHVVNYDLHWTPYKIIQRIGRIDRIGSEYDKITVINFLPETSLEKNLNLLEKVRRRAEEFVGTLGEDGQLITEEDRVNRSAMEAIYGGDIGKVEESVEGGEISITTTANKILEDFMKKHPEDYERLKNVISMRSVGSETLEKTVAFIVCSNGKKPQYYTYEYVDGEWKKVFFSIDYFINHIKENTPAVDKYDMKNYYIVAKEALDEYKRTLEEIEGVEGNSKVKFSKGTKDLLNRLWNIADSGDESMKTLASNYRDMLMWALYNNKTFRNEIAKLTAKKSWKKKKDGEILNIVRVLLESYNIPKKKKSAEMRFREKQKKSEKYKKPHIVAGLILVKNKEAK